MKTNEKTTPVLAEKDRNSVSLELMNRMKLHGMAAGLTETRWNGWPLWSSSDKRKTSSSPGRSVPGRVSWAPHWGIRHASPTFTLSMQTPRSFWKH